MGSLYGLIRATLVELLATAVYVLFGTGAAVSTGTVLAAESLHDTSSAATLHVAFAFGFVNLVIVYGLGHICGGHVNPAVTIALLLVRHIEPIQGACYVLAQLIGGVLGSALLWSGTSQLSFSPDGTVNKLVGLPPYNLGAAHLNADLAPMNGFCLEAIGTFLVCLTVLMTVKHSGNMTLGQPSLAPIPIALAIFVAHVVLLPLTGCGINPARAFGPVVVCAYAGLDLYTSVLWIFWIGPLAGAILAAGVFALLGGHDTRNPVTAAKEGDAPVSATSTCSTATSSSSQSTGTSSRGTQSVLPVRFLAPRRGCPSPQQSPYGLLSHSPAPSRQRPFVAFDFDDAVVRGSARTPRREGPRHAGVTILPRRNSSSSGTRLAPRASAERNLGLRRASFSSVQTLSPSPAAGLLPGESVPRWMGSTPFNNRRRPLRLGAGATHAVV